MTCNAIEKPFLAYLFAVAANSVFEVQSRENSAFYCYSAQYYLYKMLVFFFYHYNIRTVLFVDIIAADFPSNRDRFFLSYNVYSINYNIRMLFSFILINKATLYSITNFFPSAN